MSLGQEGVDVAVAIAQPIQQIGIGIATAVSAKKAAELRDKIARRSAASVSQRAAKDLELQMRAQMYKKPSIMPLILAGVGSLVSLGVLIFFVTK